ncbi:unnamed protein product [Polarella glacialis]|uniref:Uncharacterized protein n=1 Tax=Polarella glacialis TaxID=89957 RepID=A0A813DU68_POLGL|nr:unnamed protein product [Polarella glacialis]
MPAVAAPQSRSLVQRSAANSNSNNSISGNNNINNNNNSTNNNSISRTAVGSGASSSSSGRRAAGSAGSLERPARALAAVANNNINNNNNDNNNHNNNSKDNNNNNHNNNNAAPLSRRDAGGFLQGVGCPLSEAQLAPMGLTPELFLDLPPDTREAIIAAAGPPVDDSPPSLRNNSSNNNNNHNNSNSTPQQQPLASTGAATRSAETVPRRSVGLPQQAVASRSTASSRPGSRGRRVSGAGLCRRVRGCQLLGFHVHRHRHRHRHHHRCHCRFGCKGLWPVAASLAAPAEKLRGALLWRRLLPWLEGEQPAHHRRQAGRQQRLGACQQRRHRVVGL